MPTSLTATPPQIVDINVTALGLTPLVRDAELSFTYEVNWKRSAVTFDRRFDKYLDSSFFQHRVS